MPEFDFVINVADIVSPLFLLVVMGAIRVAQKQLEKHFDMRHDEIEAKQDERYDEMTRDLNYIKDMYRADHDLLMVIAGKVGIVPVKVE